MTASRLSPGDTLKALAGVARAPFLLLSVTLVAVGAAAASREGSFSWGRTAVALLGLVGLHVAVNAFNEVSDLRSGIDLETRKTPFTGGSGVLPSGRLGSKAAMRLGMAGAAIGVSAGVWFLVVVGWKLLPILAIGAIATLSYTDYLARRLVGELAAGLGLGALPVLGTAMVQAGNVGDTPILVALPAFLMTFNLLLLNEFPDQAADQRGGRRNLVLALGPRRAARLYVACAAISTLWLLGTALAGLLPRLALVALLPAPLLVPPLRWALSGPDRDVPVRALAGNVAWILGTNALLAAALAISSRLGP